MDEPRPDMERRVFEARVEGMLTGMFTNYPAYYAAVVALNEEYGRRAGGIATLERALWRHRGAPTINPRIREMRRALQAWYAEERRRLDAAW